MVLECLFNKLDILQSQLFADNVEISCGVDVTLNVNNLGIVKATYDLEDGIDSANMRQEGVSKTSTRRGTTGETGNIVDGQVGGHNRLGLVLFHEPVEPLIGYDDAGLLGLNSGIRKVLGELSAPCVIDMVGGQQQQRASYSRIAKVALCNGLEQGGFANVGETDNTTLQVIAWSAQRELLLDDCFLGRHLSGFGVVTGRWEGDDESTAKARSLSKGRCRPSCAREKGLGIRSERGERRDEGRRGAGFWLQRASIAFMKGDELENSSNQEEAEWPKREKERKKKSRREKKVFV